MNQSYNVNNYNWEGKKILIAEDIASNYNFLRLLLKRSRVDLVWVENGQDAVDKVESGENFDLVLLDINLPLMNGYDVARNLKRIAPNLPIIAQTAYALEGDREKAILAGCDDYVPKPIVISTLLRKMHLYLK
jgi:CheY-like chemotaxis protein